MRLPWHPRKRPERLMLRALDGGGLAFALLDGERLLRWGLLAGGAAPACGSATALLDPGSYQILKVDTPNVPAEELKAAARFQVKDLVDADMADLTLDVMHLGGDVPRSQRQLFVVAARASAITALTQQVAAFGPALEVIDIWETALRNLLTAQARRDDLFSRACAAVLIDGAHSLLLICAGGELFYTRRLEADPALLARARGEQAGASSAELPLGFEYQPGGAFDTAGTEESPLVVELQRSIDVWERSWPDLPLARLYLLSAEQAPEVAALIQRELGQRTVALDALTHFSAPPPEGDPALALAACLPLLGAALRADTKVP